MANKGPQLLEPSTATVAPLTSQTISGSYSDAFAASNPGMLFLSISDTSGTLSATNSSGHTVNGSGTSSIQLPISYTDLVAALKSLTYTADGAGSDVISFDVWNQAGVETTGTVPVTITEAGPNPTGPTLTEPALETVAPLAMQTISGSYADSFAAANPGLMFLSISARNGRLSAVDTAGHVIAGSGTNEIALNATFNDLNAVLKSLTYTADGAGSDVISFDVWNQAGVETTGSVAVTVTGSPSGPQFSYSRVASQNPVTTISDINNSGDVVGFTGRFSGLYPSGSAFAYSGSAFTTIDGPGNSYTTANAINDSGEIVGITGNPPGPASGFAYSNGTSVAITPPGAIYNIASAVNNRGEIAGSYSDSSGSHGYIYDDGTFTKFDVPGAETVYAVLLNDNGEIAGSFIDINDNTLSFIYHDGVMATLNPPGAAWSSATALNHLGEVVGNYMNTPSGTSTHGFLYKDGQFTTLDMPGATSTHVSDINQSGEIAGY